MTNILTHLVMFLLDMRWLITNDPETAFETWLGTEIYYMILN